MRFSHALWSIAAMAWLVSPAAAVNLVVNGGFETGDFTGWTESNPGAIVVSNGQPHTGTFSALYTNSQGLGDELEQNIPTVNGTPYRISFWIFNLGVGGDYLAVLWDQDVVLESEPLASPLEDWQLFEIDVVADDNTQALTFIGFDDNSAFYLDDISVEAIPEPSVCVLMAVGALGLVGVHMRRRK